MTTIDTHDPVAVAVTTAIHRGRLDDLRRLLDERPGLAVARLGDDEPDGTSRSLLHVATDWPAHFPEAAATIVLLVGAGADVDARFRGSHRETALHWAASADDVAALEALLDAGADIEADGGVIADGTALGDATAFGAWAAARALVARGARTSVFDLAALGMNDPVVAALEDPVAPADGLHEAFWAACHGGRLDTAQLLAARGAEIDWLPGWERATPLDIAARDGAHDVVRWLHRQGAHTCDELDDHA